jgi:hypothetical protein
MSKRKNYTVSYLHKMLEKLIEQGHGRLAVCVEKSSFEHPLESDGCIILPVQECKAWHIPILDDDGGTKILKNGCESRRLTCVLYGNTTEDRMFAERRAEGK